MKSYLPIILKTIYLIEGIYPDLIGHEWISRTYVSLFSVILVGNFLSCSLLLLEDGINEILFEAAAAFFMQLTVFRTFFYGRQNVEFFVRLYRETVHFSNTSDEFVKLSNRILARLVHFGMICQVAISFILAIPFCIIMFTDVEMESVNALMFVSWYPWKRNTPVKYMFTILLQLAIGLYSYCVFVFGITSFTMGVIFVYVRFLMIKQRILTFEEEIKRQSEKARPEYDLERSIYLNFIRIIQVHQDFLRYA